MPGQVGRVVGRNPSYGLILEINNGSDHDLTWVKVQLRDKQTQSAQIFQLDVFNPFDPSVIGYGPRHKVRIVRSLTSGYYTFPLPTVVVPQNEFWSKYEVTPLAVGGISHKENVGTKSEPVDRRTTVLNWIYSAISGTDNRASK